MVEFVAKLIILFAEQGERSPERLNKLVSAAMEDKATSMGGFFLKFDLHFHEAHRRRHSSAAWMERSDIRDEPHLFAKGRCEWRAWPRMSAALPSGTVLAERFHETDPFPADSGLLRLRLAMTPHPRHCEARSGEASLCARRDMISNLENAVPVYPLVSQFAGRRVPITGLVTISLQGREWQEFLGLTRGELYEQHIQRQ
jgi:hypothetical protein